MKTKLELTWIGKDNRPKLEPRILVEEKDKAHHANLRHSESDQFDNKLIFGDNLLALKALESEYTGQVKCVFLDPPYNTGSAFEHYDDGVEHSLWLSLIRDRLQILWNMLNGDGSIWIAIDDNECHYLKVLCDELFCRKSFVSAIVWQNRYSRSNDASISLSHNSILVYAKNPDSWKNTRNRLTRTSAQADQYKNPDNDPKGPWRAIPWDAPNIRPNLEYPIITASGEVRLPPPGRHWSRTEDQWLEIVKNGLAYFGKKGDGAPSFKQYLSEASAIVPNSWWPHEEAGHTDEAKKEMHGLFGKDQAFDTPKPERLIQRILHIATNPGDLVLDSFLGSGTTAAVAHKMGRRWIGIELGEHCHTHCIPRLKKVIDGQDPGGITEAVGWKGGGGFRYYRLAPSLLEQDKWGNWVISKEYNAAMLAEALCKLEGFRYEPSDSVYWMHGRSSESDFMYATTQNLSTQQLQELSDDVGPARSLLVLCAAFRGNPDQFPNLTLKKIPKAVLAKCEWGHDDYSLKIENLPKAPEPSAPAPVNAGRKSKTKTDEPDLFSEAAQ
jgi:adenine-specific DNA-methyltransferase